MHFQKNSDILFSISICNLSYVLYAKDTTRLSLNGITFFGGGASFIGATNSTISDCTFDHSSYPPRALGSTVQSSPALSLDGGSGNIVSNSLFQYIDAIAIELTSEGSDIIENNDFFQIDTNVATETFKVYFIIINLHNRIF